MTVTWFVPCRAAVALARLRPLYVSSSAMDVAQRDYAVGDQLWVRSVSKLRADIMSRPETVFSSEESFRAFLRESHAYWRRPNESQLVDLAPMVLEATERHFPGSLRAAVVLRESADLRNPSTWFPRARAMKRKFVVHAGPTNSGKTYHAIERLKAARSGVYCAPLRLLAQEVYETLNQQGVITSLITGQERREMMFSEHVSCTVEMADIDRPVEVAVIDEMQLVGEEQRGWAWTRAIMGLPAEEIHLCGDPASTAVMQHLAAISGDEVVVHDYKRLSDLVPETESLGGDYANVQPGDCIVAFSRKEIYAIRRIIERKTPHKCCVVYGSLPPETRSAQAKLFNDPDSGAYRNVWDFFSVTTLFSLESRGVYQCLFPSCRV